MTSSNLYFCFVDTNGTGEENPTAVFVPLDLLENYKDDTNGEKLEPSSNLIADVDIEPEDSKKEVIWLFLCSFRGAFLVWSLGYLRLCVIVLLQIASKIQKNHKTSIAS